MFVNFWNSNQENQEELKLNGTHQFVLYADDVDIVGANINTLKIQKFC